MPNKNDDFNFEEFAVQAIRLIDSLRSFGKEGGKKPKESRINAFYRAVGLPCVVPLDKNAKPDDCDKKDTSVNNPDQFNNGNVFANRAGQETSALNYSNFEVKLSTRQTDFEKEHNDDDIEDFLDLNKKDLRASVIETEPNKRPSGVLFPMVVDGAIHVYPQSRRIGGAFMTESQLKHPGQIIYKRPLLEVILNIKLKGENIVDSAKQTDVSAAFQLMELKFLNDKALEKLNSSLNNIGPLLEKAVGKANRINTKVGLTIIPTIANVAQQNPEVRPSTKRIGELDIQKENLEDKKRIADTVLSLFEFDDTAGTSHTRNLRDAALAGPLLGIITPKTKSRTEKDLEEVNNKIDNATAEAKSAFRTLDLLLGTFSGLSGLDIIVVLVALFRLENNVLVGLLNEEGQKNLKTSKGNLTVLSQATSVETSIAKLKTEVVKIFDEVISSVKITKHRNKKHNQEKE